jgi:hypothetical protein
MTEEELFDLWNEMRKKRIDDGLTPPFEPSPIEFAARVAAIAYAKGFNEGHKMGSTGPFGEPLE